MLENLSINGTHLLVQMVGFLLLFWLLSTYMFGPLARVIEERERRVKERMDEAERNSLEMQKMRNDYQQRIARIETESRDLIHKAMQEAHAARDEMLEKARADAENLLARGRQEITREKHKALVEMRDQVADLAIQAAEKLIEKSLDPKTHRSLIDGVIDRGVKSA